MNALVKEPRGIVPSFAAGAMADIFRILISRFHAEKGCERACIVKPVASVFAWSSLDARWTLNCHQPINYVKPGPRQVLYLTLSFSHKESEEAEETTEKTLAKEPRGVFCAVKGLNLRNHELGHASTWLPTSSIFMQFQCSTGPDTWNSKFQVARSISLSIRFQFPRFDFEVLHDYPDMHRLSACGL